MPADPKELLEYKTDHDILIELRIEMRLLRQSIEKRDASTSDDIADHEKRLRFIERYMWLAIGGFTLIELGLTILSNNGFHL